mgnify:FL=1
MSWTCNPDSVSAAAEPSVVLAVNRFHGASTDRLPRPETRVSLTPTSASLRVRFDVAGSALLASNTQRQSSVYRDSCVEFFFEPIRGAGYINVEINCIGTPLAHFHPTYQRNEVEKLDDAAIDSLNIRASLPHERIAPERRGETSWWLAFEVSYDAVARVVGRKVEDVAGPGLSLRWRGNFYKCGDHTSSPHWASWAPLHETLDFHVPDCFAPIAFDEAGCFLGSRSGA